MALLENINDISDLRALPREQLPELCREIRSFLIENVSRTGGHLASNLGTVELCVALDRVYDPYRDRLVFDVGHQCYTHKLLTGRRAGFAGLRQYGGMSGFPKPSESGADAFIAGHASNSVSVALGMARARTRLGGDYDVAAVIGDGALTGGLAYEGLSNAGQSGEPLVVVLNDNAMSIGSNVGGMAKLLSRMRVKPGYFRFKRWYRSTVGRVKPVYELSHRLKEGVKEAILPENMFDDLGFYYLGPVDGHDVEALESALAWAREMRVPVLLHVITRKGRGYPRAELDPERYHGVGPFDPEKGVVKGNGGSFSAVIGKALCRAAERDARVSALTAAMADGTGLSDFAKRFPERFYDTGIAEGHTVSMAAGMAKQGMIPVAAIYSTFLQRSFDMLLHDVALQQLHVVLAVDRAGLVGEDGETHHGMFDVGYLRLVPGMRVYCPANFAELRSMLREAVLECKGPVAIRYPRGGEGKRYLDVQTETCIREGADCTLVCYGTTVEAALEAADRCAAKGVSVEILKLATVAPLDFDAVAGSVRKTGRIVVAEETSDRGCVADELFARLGQAQIPFVGRKKNLGRRFVTHGATAILLREAGLDADGMTGLIGEVCGHEA